MPAARRRAAGELVEVRRGRTSVAALRGHAGCLQEERHVELAAGQSTRMTRDGIAAPEELRDTQPPAWFEQLRALEHGIRIRAVETSYDSIGVDTPDDLEQVRRLLAADRAN